MFRTLGITVPADQTDEVLREITRLDWIIGVLIGLALIPAAALVGLALSRGDLTLAGQAFLRWGIDVGIVAFGSLIVLGWKQARVYWRRMML